MSHNIDATLDEIGNAVGAPTEPEEEEDDEKDEKPKDPERDEDGKLILKNGHLHNMAAGLHGVMETVGQMRAVISQLIDHNKRLTDEVASHEKTIKALIEHAGQHAERTAMHEAVLDKMLSGRKKAAPAAPPAEPPAEV